MASPYNYLLIWRWLCWETETEILTMGVSEGWYYRGVQFQHYVLLVYIFKQICIYDNQAPSYKWAPVAFAPVGLSKAFGSVEGPGWAYAVHSEGPGCVLLTMVIVLPRPTSHSTHQAIADQPHRDVGNRQLIVRASLICGAQRRTFTPLQRKDCECNSQKEARNYSIKIG